MKPEPGLATSGFGGEKSRLSKALATIMGFGETRPEAAGKEGFKTLKKPFSCDFWLWKPSKTGRSVA
jgi:hypothetical protein